MISGAVASGLYSMRKQPVPLTDIMFDIIKQTMLQPIAMEPYEYPELIVKEQEELFRGIIFSKDTGLYLIEDAQGREALSVHLRIHCMLF